MSHLLLSQQLLLMHASAAAAAAAAAGAAVVDGCDDVVGVDVGVDGVGGAAAAVSCVHQLAIRRSHALLSDRGRHTLVLLRVHRQVAALDMYILQSLLIWSACTAVGITRDTCSSIPLTHQ
eukprot:13208-Heterococcus_DN1.PRE.2